ncbi:MULTISPECIES: carbamate kinase [Lactobacillus]|uniref:Carbamate kinase n=1 Tax=Lactobacillus panisapium TaxID=2012495 RepID=A0ABX8WD41_9LACO|nr:MULTISPECIES: carbamate kinase [Lactobacillus]MCO6533005.1 carbamate kinase [Lactobacillus sp.]MCX8736805.1 carbamate kinase [Lactobacillus sp. B4026]QYN53448.1 carbamate kinase [Lactobacillus panisapium]QYN59203.1 carbamate kinase [Lactobacillus panisapium]
MKRIVVALGGNAILTDDPSAQAQQAALLRTANYLTDFIAQGDIQLVITHGNGPQVGNLLLQELAGSSESNPAMPLDTVGAMTQGEIGLWLANALDMKADERQLPVKIMTMLTRTVVDEHDKAFQNPSKPIGVFYQENEVNEVKKEHPDWQLVEDAGRGFRRVVPSPKPLSIMEADAIKSLVEKGMTLIAAGGGGVPVIKSGEEIRGVEAVIDKDFSAAKLAELVDADQLIILTAVKYVAINYHKPSQRDLHQVKVAEMKQFLSENQFAPGSMKPKVEAAISFVEKSNKPAVITSLDNISSYLKNGDGTIILPD